MGFLSFLVLLAIAYLIWRVTDQLPDLIFRLSEIQRDVADIRRRLADQGPATGSETSTPTTPPPSSSAPPPAPSTRPQAPTAPATGTSPGTGTSGSDSSGS